MGGEDFEFTRTQQRVFAIAPKPSAVLSFVASIYLITCVLRNPSKRKKMYHRLIVGMSINSLIQSVVYFLGTWPIPKGAPGFYGAVGTVETCTAQGFMIQFGFAVPFYYAALSFYAFLAVRSNFKEERIVWTEKYIHMGVYMVPLGTAIGLMKIEMLNPIGPWCWIDSYPMGCEGGECIRGTANIQKIGMLFAGIPMFCFLGFATLMMILLYLSERRRRMEKIGAVGGKTRFLEEARRRKASLVGRQASLYLAAFYLTYSFSIVNGMIKIYTGEIYFPTYIIGSCFQPLMGVLNLIVYCLLTPKKVDTTSLRKHSWLSRTTSCLAMPSFTSTSYALPAQETSKSTIAGVTPESSRDKEWCREEFSIFDGTNPSDEWKDFILEEDEAEETDDNHVVTC